LRWRRRRRRKRRYLKTYETYSRGGYLLDLTTLYSFENGLY